MRTLFTLTLSLLYFISAAQAQLKKGDAGLKEYPPTLDSVLATHYFPRWLGNIDSKDFPKNTQLQSFLNHNTNFIFKLSMDLYLDMVRFKMLDTTYDDKKIKNFLRLYDLFYLKYQNDIPLLEQKVKLCKNTLQEACSRFNLMDIYYKDYNVDLSAINAQNKPFTFISYDAKDDYYSTKRIKGEADASYAANALNVYLTNWVSMNALDDPAYVDTIIAKSGTTQLTMRIYFLLQPLAVVGDDGGFKGTTAYGLKAVLFNNCPSKPLTVISNQNLQKITEPVVKKCYTHALAYLDDSVKYVGYEEVINSSILYEDGSSDLGQWFEPFDDCEIAYNYLSGNIERLAGKGAKLSLKMLTNYNCTLQPGYEITFANRLTGASFSLPVIDANTVQSESAMGYYNLDIIIPAVILKKMLDAHVNSISFQCSGPPKYRTAKSYVLPYPNKVITRRLGSISASLDLNESGHAEMLENLLKKGL